MDRSLQEYHVLQVEEPTSKCIYHLDVATISIGRDPSNTISISDPFVSRHHTILLRVPSQNGQYAYLLQDGDVNGTSSKNGVLVNQKSYMSKRLVTGDRIILGETHLSYLIASMTAAEFHQYFDAEPLTFHSLKEEVLDPIGTLMTEFFSVA